MRLAPLLLFSATLFANCAPLAQADMFGSSPNRFTIDFVTVGSPGNPPDANPNPAGAVPYVYRIAKYEISEQMIDKANALGGLGITIDARGPDKPATSVTWFEAARFVNWLNQFTGHDPAYKFDAAGVFQLWQPGDPGYDATNLYRNAGAKYFLPSLDEWHKAAYYDPVAGRYWDYPTGSDAVPDGIDFPGDTVFDAVFYDGGNQLGPNDVFDVGIASPNGAFGLGGNVAEWEETSFDLLNNVTTASRGYRGGAWGNILAHLLGSNRNGIGPSFESDFFGIRVASIVPEPRTIWILLVGLAVLARVVT